MQHSTKPQSTKPQTSLQKNEIITLDISSAEMLNEILPTTPPRMSIIDSSLVESVEVIRLIHHPTSASQSEEGDISGMPYILSPTDDDAHQCVWTRDWIDIDVERMIMIEYCEECGATKKN